MLRDRLLGVLCLGAATLTATWGGNPALERASAQAGRLTTPDAQAAADPAATSPDSGPAAPADPETTATTAPPASTTTATATGTPAATAPPGEAPAVLAHRALLTQADLPAGFTQAVPAPADNAAPGDSPFERCAGPSAGSLTAAIGARARSAAFAKPDTGSSSSLSAVLDQPSSAEKLLGVMTTPAARQCFEDLINARLARNPKLSQDVKGSLGPAPSPTVGDGAVAYRFDVRLPAEDVDKNARPEDPPVRFVADFVLFRKGRTLVLAEFDNLRQPWVDDTLRGVVASLAAHA